MRETPVCTAADAIYKLAAGNLKYLNAENGSGDISRRIRMSTWAKGQSPYAIIVTCSDSRVIPENIFSAGIGELFVIRLAGNIIDDHQLGSIIYMDGTADITRTYPLGPLTEDEKRFYTWTLQSHIDLAKAVWLDYCECKMIDTIAREPLWRHLINYRCGTGHSVSFVGNVHEGPHALNSRNTTRMRPGMVVTDEPGVYETDLVGIRIENELVCVHKADNQYGTFLGFEPLMFVPIATSPILPGVLDKDEIAWLNDYHRQVFAKLAPHLNDEERSWLAEKCAAIGC